jgi:hypothetical protein
VKGVRDSVECESASERRKLDRLLKAFEAGIG